MMAHAGKVLTHHFIVQEIWGRGANVQYLRIYIRALRQKIEADPERPYHYPHRNRRRLSFARTRLDQV